MVPSPRDTARDTPGPKLVFVQVTPHTPSQSLESILDHLAHLLPAQGPIGVFIHHNTLHAFQHKPFEEAVTDAARTFQAEPYMTEAAYRAAYACGRIRTEDLDAVLAGAPQPTLLRNLLTGIRDWRPETIHWALQEGELADAANTEELAFWQREVREAATENAAPARPRDGVLAATGEDTDDWVHPLLIRLAGAYLDQGLAYWPMPNREAGFWRCSLELLERSAVAPAGLAGLKPLACEWQGLEAGEAAEKALAFLGVGPDEWGAVLQAELLALPGWAGLFHQLESDPTLAPHEALPARLVDFVAVRLFLTAVAASAALPDARNWSVPGPLSPSSTHSLALARAATYWDAACATGFRCMAATPNEVAAFRQMVDGFGSWERRRVWHAAYERRHERMILLPLQQHAAEGLARTPDRLAAQVFFCIDEREESIRRHLEEADPEIETLGAAGFFGVAMDYKGLDDAHGVALCPVVVKPAHAVQERPSDGHHEAHSRRQSLRRAWARVARQSFVSSRTLVRGWLGTTVLGVFSLIPLAARVLSPRRYGRLMNWLNASVLPEPRTELMFMRSDAQGHDATEGLLQGFTVAEKVARVASVLGPAGLHKGMARLVVILGHGSTSLNNPHESAYNCGACGGRNGGPNGRLFAAMANHPEVRAGLKDAGICIGDDVWFLGGYHDTCNDDVAFFDDRLVPAGHQADLERLQDALDQARARNALERCRRFAAAPHSDNPAAALHHVQERAEHLAEPRPEYGHSSNSFCVVGRRRFTRGLFLDRRAFLVSYTAEKDPDNRYLAQLLQAVIPVCAGISLEYFFSTVDNERYGCGTKLPHNVAGLVGVMNGGEGDLRTGLTLQMVEIHEPVRILFAVESTPDRVLSVIRAHPLLWEFLDNRWIRLATIDPVDATRIHVYRGGDHWERIEGDDERLAAAATSLDWSLGKREHLPMARIRSAA